MKKLVTALSAVTAMAVLLTACQSNSSADGQATGSKAGTLQQVQEQFLEKADVTYAHDLAVKLGEFGTNEKLGYRTAGSDAELEAGDFLKAEMESIGLTDVTKDEFTLDTWTFKKADLKFTAVDGTEHLAVLGGYQTNFVTDGFETHTVVDGGTGTPADLEGLDVAGKLILVDINQRENWWITYPAYQAKLLGAAGVIAVQDGGYAQVSPDALNSQDICGVADAPAFSMSRTDAQLLRGAMEAAGTNELAVQLDADSQVKENGTSYNIVGRIEGKNPDRMIMVTAHYDAYFTGFQDDSTAIGLMMSIAKGLVDSGYQPENTIVFCATAAEEWGVTNTRYDWSTGAYNQVFRVHPEWAGKVIADINFELPATNEGTTNQIRTTYELKSFLESFSAKVPAVEGAYPDGIELICPLHTWSDDFSFSIAGIPSTVTSLRDGFAETHYHSQFDNTDTYSEAGLQYNLNLYGMLLLEYDHVAIPPLDFTTRLDAMKDKVDPEVYTRAGLDSAPLLAAIEEARTAAASAWEKIKEQNAACLAALDAGDTEAAQEIYAANEALFAQTLVAYKFAEDSFVRLTWEDINSFPQELPQNNLAMLYSSIDSLTSGDTMTAYDEYLWQIDNNWYAYDWSREVYDYFTSYVLNQPTDRLMWGAGRVVGHEDLFDVVKSLGEKYGTDENVEGEIAALTAAIDNQCKLLTDLTARQIEDLGQLTEMLSAIGK